MNQYLHMKVEKHLKSLKLKNWRELLCLAYYGKMNFMKMVNLFQKESIRINAVAPGITATEMTGINVEGNINAGSYATGRFYIPQEIAEVATFLISDESGCVSGQIITCNNAQTVNPRWK